MELTYRGITYQASLAHAETYETEQIGMYRGVPYRTRRVKPSLRRPSATLMYRGVRYHQ